MVQNSLRVKAVLTTCNTITQIYPQADGQIAAVDNFLPGGDASQPFFPYNNVRYFQELMVKQPHELVMDVRDYECDLQGVVNNAVYMNYLEHARHEYLKSRDVDFAEVTRQGIHLVVVRAELDYRKSLTSGDGFSITTRFERDGRLKIVFIQEIIRRRDELLMLSARITATALNEKGRPFVPEEILAKLAD